MLAHDTVGQQADHLAREALTAQLQLLQAILPMAVWLVARRKEAHWRVLADTGDPSITDVGQRLSELLEIMPYDRTDRFTYRACRAAKRARLEAHLPTHLHPHYLFRALLEAPDGHGQGVVFGLQPSLEAQVLRTRDISLCLEVMRGILRLQDELIATERLVLETRREALLDPLTGALNRAGWDHYVQQIDAHLKSTDGDAVTMILDLDRLKSVNDRHGHAAGDELLKRTAATLHAVLRRRDCVARLGGDEFALLLQDITPTDAVNLRQRLATALRDSGIEVSLGTAMRSETGALRNALALADERMYSEKRGKVWPLRWR